MRYLKTLLTAGALSGIMVATTAVAQTSQRVAFARGNDNTSVTGSITGHQYRDYLVGARAGQRMGVSMIQKAKTAVYFNILPPGSTDEAIYNSSVSGDDATGIPLTKTGTYRVRVYLMGAAERGKRPMPFQLSIAVM